MDCDEYASIQKRNDVGCVEDNKHDEPFVNYGITADSNGGSTSGQKSGGDGIRHKMDLDENTCMQDDNDTDCVKHYEFDLVDNEEGGKEGGHNRSFCRKIDAQNGLCIAVKYRMPTMWVYLAFKVTTEYQYMKL